jgi:hypothetical protein
MGPFYSYDHNEKKLLKEWPIKIANDQLSYQF